jgi:hypothetical protein
MMKRILNRDSFNEHSVILNIPNIALSLTKLRVDRCWIWDLKVCLIFFQVPVPAPASQLML